MQLPNSIRKTIHIVSERIFDIWWDWYYKYFQHPPWRYCDEWERKHWDEGFYDPVCFPLPFRINCLGCTGCATVDEIDLIHSSEDHKDV